MHTTIEVLPTFVRERAALRPPKRLLYPNYADNDGLIPPPENASGLEKPIHRSRKADHFRLLHERDARIAGFRAVITRDDRLLVDESEVDRFSYDALFDKLAGPQNEDMTFRIENGAAHIQFETDPIVIDRPVIFLGSDEPSNFGSWIYRILPKVIDAPYRDYPVLVYNNAPWMNGLLGRMFHGNVSVINHWPRRCYLLREAIIPTLRNVDVYFDEEVRTFYKYAAAAIDGKSPLEKVYLSRRGQKGRPLLNEDELEERLGARGFHIVRPETLSISDQIRIMRDARVIVCPGGSGLFSMVFATSAEFVLDIESGTEWLYAHHNLLRSTAKPHTILFGEREPEHTSPHAPWRVDVHAVLTALAHAGA